MFEWLERELTEIRTPRFHIVDGPPNSKLQARIRRSKLVLPASYKEFVLKFGNARLYRRSQNGYRIGVFAGPRQASLSDGTQICHLGFHDGATVYVKLESNSVHFPIFEFEEESEIVADDFGEWLEASCAHARRSVAKRKWASLLQGPKPFTLKEKALIAARRAIRWQVLGVDGTGDHILQITNASSQSLPCLTIGVRSTNKRLNGAVSLKIGDLMPGHTVVLHVNCYKELVPPTDVELFAFPDPQPEDREFYRELK